MGDFTVDKFIMEEKCEYMLKKVGLTKAQVRRMTGQNKQPKSRFSPVKKEGYSVAIPVNHIKKHARKVGMYCTHLTLKHTPSDIVVSGTGSDYNKLYRSLIEEIKLQLAE